MDCCRKDYSCDGMFKVSLNDNKVTISAYIVVLSSSFWHDHLTHIRYRSLMLMAKHGLISYEHDNKQTCKVCKRNLFLGLKDHQAY